MSPARIAVIAVIVVVVVGAAACGGNGSGDDTVADDAGDDAPSVDAEPAADAAPPGPCNDVQLRTDPPAGTHMPVGTPIEWPTNPPSGGPHFPTWMRWNATYDPPADRGFWVHNTEHGGVVLLFNCPTACPDVVADLSSLIQTVAADPKCVAPLRNRLLVTSDPLLPATTQVAASAWGALYTADCYDEPSLLTFIAAHYDHAPESTCAEGGVP
jgi:hypothetical protein